MKFINNELREFKQKISPLMEISAIHPNFSKNGFVTEEKAEERRLHLFKDFFLKLFKVIF